ncbi:MAG: MopE-related protein [Pseudomonadota bacterium]|nr:MopE-related protein [Pseudomonadota bacterium]
MSRFLGPPRPTAPLARGLRWGLVLGGLAGCGPMDEDSGGPEIVLVDVDGDGWALPLDCDDTLVGIHPGATERCNGGDDDCDGQIDDHPIDGFWGWLDMDRDGWGDAATRDLWCGDFEAVTLPWVTNDGDCDDGDFTVHPNAVETCGDATDEDCDGNHNDLGASGCVPWYEDLDGDGVGIESDRCLCEAEGNYRAASAGDCDDGDRERIDTCGVSGAHSLESADIAIVGASPRDGAGSAVAAVGDPDGDGWPDLVIAGTGTRATWRLVRGPYAGDKDLGAASAVFSESTLSSAVSATASGGVDLDADGADDIVIAGYGLDGASGSRWVGVAYVVSGAVSGTVDLDAADARFLGPNTTAQFSIDVAASPDTDGDGIGDLLVGGTWSESAWLFRGPLDGPMETADAALTLTDAGGRLGTSVAAAGDVDGDGLADLLAGAQTAGDASVGAAWLVSGGTSGPINEADATAVLWGAAPISFTGASVAGPGDVDGDGYDDVLVGGPATVGAMFQAGSVWLVHGPVSGSFALDDAAARVDGIAIQSGAFVTGRAGDVDADGAADLLVGVPNADTVGTLGGAAMLFFGPVSGTVRTVDADVRLYGLAAGDTAGTAVAGAGDLDKDGYDDLLVGVPGLDLGALDAGGAYVWRGGPR